jgi:protoheme IX farnesyltransferase
MAERSQSLYSRKSKGVARRYFAGLKPYFLVTKPATVTLLVFTGVVGFAVASRGVFPAGDFLVFLAALTLGCAGANTLTCYCDRDIDAIMARTRKRPIPSLHLAPSRALIYGLALSAFALALSLELNALTFLLILAGILNNVIMHSAWTKRKTPFNIIIGSLAGGLPAVAGYAAYAGAIDLRALFLGGIVMVWIPVHIWSLAIKYAEDYRRAGVPMLPVVVSQKSAVRIIAFVSCLMVVVSLVPVALGLFGMIYFFSAVVLGAISLALSFWLMASPSDGGAWAVFKISSIYLGLLFLSVLLDFLLTV